jgi:hypothetical protein
MKRNLFLLSTMALVITSAMFWSCQKEEMMNEDVMLKKGKVEAIYNFSTNVSDVCAGGNLILTLTGSGNKQIQMLVNGEWVQVEMVPQGNEPLEATIEGIAAGAYYFRHTSNKGYNIVGPITISSCPGSSCEDLEVELVCGEDGEPNVLTVTFTAGADGDYVIQGGLNAKVDGDLVSWDADKGGFNLTHNGVTNSNANVIRWEGYLEACEVVVITVEFSGKCEIGNWTAEIE